MKYSNFVFLKQANGYQWATVDVTTPKHLLFWKVSETTETKGICRKVGYHDWRWEATGEHVPPDVDILIACYMAQKAKEAHLEDIKLAYDKAFHGL